eukprot:8254727-Heterocapsa_arctica.AAC.1
MPRAAVLPGNRRYGSTAALRDKVSLPGSRDRPRVGSRLWRCWKSPVAALAEVSAHRVDLPQDGGMKEMMKSKMSDD